MIVYFDTGGLLKLFVDETHTEETRNWARAADLAFEHGLRGFDAVQLAAALTARDNAGAETFAFASFDLALNRAARAKGLTVPEPLD